MILSENIQEFRSVGAWNLCFCAHFASGVTMWPKWPDHGTTGWTRGLQTQRLFCMKKVFREGSRAVDLDELVKCYGNLQDKFQRILLTTGLIFLTGFCLIPDLKELTLNKLLLRVVEMTTFLRNEGL